jgi:hypothetical protein
MTRKLNALALSCSRLSIAMIRRRSVLLWLLTTTALVLPAQETAPAGFEQWTAKSLARYMAEMAEEAPDDPHRFAVRQLVDYPNDSFLLVHRAADGPVEWHKTQADVFFVQSLVILGHPPGPVPSWHHYYFGGAGRLLSVGTMPSPSFTS